MIAFTEDAAPPLRMSHRCLSLIVECGQWPTEMLFEHYLEWADLADHLDERASVFPLSDDHDLYIVSNTKSTAILLDDEYEHRFW